MLVCRKDSPRDEPFDTLTAALQAIQDGYSGWLLHGKCTPRQQETPRFTRSQQRAPHGCWQASHTFHRHRSMTVQVYAMCTTAITNSNTWACRGDSQEG